VAAWKRKWFQSPADRLCLVWAVVVVIFFSLSKSKMPGYILTVTVACGILVARFFEQALANPDGKAARIAGRAAITLAVLCLVAATTAIILSPRMGSLAKPMGLSVDDVEALRRHFLVPIIMLLAFVVLGLLARVRRDVGLCFVSFTIFPLLLFTLNLGAIEVIFNVKAARQLAQQIPPLSPQTELVFVECYPGGLPFYLKRLATLITRDGNELTSNYILFELQRSASWPTNMVPVTELDRWQAGRNHPAYFLTHAGNRALLETIAGIQKTNIQQLTPLYVGVLLPAP
jgi:hypothetical protein